MSTSRLTLLKQAFLVRVLICSDILVQLRPFALTSAIRKLISEMGHSCCSFFPPSPVPLKRKLLFVFAAPS